jgi:hypothetical protein
MNDTNEPAQLADTLNVKNQEIAAEHQKIAAESNKALVALTLDTVDDSSTVKTITFVTLFYLPASFISVSPGVALFLFCVLRTCCRTNANFIIN